MTKTVFYKYTADLLRKMWTIFMWASTHCLGIMSFGESAATGCSKSMAALTLSTTVFRQQLISVGLKYSTCNFFCLEHPCFLCKPHAHNSHKQYKSLIFPYIGKNFSLYMISVFFVTQIAQIFIAWLACKSIQTRLSHTACHCLWAT